MRLHWHWKIISTSRLLDTIFRLRRPTSFARRQVDRSAASTQVWFKIRRAAEWAALAQVRLEPAQAVPPAELAAQVRALRAWSQSTLGTGTNVSSYDPILTGALNNEHFTQPLSNIAIYGVPTLQQNTTNGNVSYTQAFPTGTALSAVWDNSRGATNSPNSFLNPSLNSYYHVLLQQQLLAGFGFGPNLRFLKIAKNNQKISDEAFTLQVITTVTQIANMYWDLVAAYDDEQVKSRSLDFANQTLASDQKQLSLQAIPAMDVMKAEGEVAVREQDLTVAKTTLQFQELLMKNALTKNLDDPALEAMPVHPTDKSGSLDGATQGQTEDMIAKALRDRIELRESDLDLDNRRISQTGRPGNNVLPSVALTGILWRHGTRRPGQP